MIVIARIPSEQPVRLVLDAAEGEGIEAVVLNPREAAHADLAIFQTGGTLQLQMHRTGETVDLHSAHGVYTRLGGYEGLPDYRQGTPQERAWIIAWHGIVNAWIETTPIPVLNPIKACNSNMSKPYQARIIAECGLDVPKTLITNDPERARAFRQAHGSVIFKSISAHRSIVRLLEGAHFARLDQIRFLPVQFQECIAGTDIRVHVMGDAVFATRIDSDAQDYRYADAGEAAARYSPTALPGDIANACRRLSRRFDLPLCGIDLRVADDGRYVCFEVNPSPAYSCYEEQTGQPVAAAIVDWLHRAGAARPAIAS